MAYYQVTEGWNENHDYGNGKKSAGPPVSIPEEVTKKFHKLMDDLYHQDRFIRVQLGNGETSNSVYEPSEDHPIYIHKKFKDMQGALAYKELIAPFNPCFFDIVYKEDDEVEVDDFIKENPIYKKGWADGYRAAEKIYKSFLEKL